MPHCVALPAIASRRGEAFATSCIHEFIRTEKWSESETTEGRITDDFGRKTGPIQHRRMITTFEKYRCRLCGEEDIQSYTVWEKMRR